MEVGPDGSVKSYAGPMVYTAEGAVPIDAPAPLRLRSRSRQAASREDFNAAAYDTNLSGDLIAAVAWRESGFRRDAVSRRGAVGEMQLMPATARALGVDAADVSQNVKGGASYLGQLLRRYDGDLVRALAAYNAGPAAVDRYGGVPPYKETQAYVAAVLERLSRAVAPAAGLETAGR